MELGFLIRIVSRIPDSWSWITDSKVRESGFHKQKFPESWNLQAKLISPEHRNPGLYNKQVSLVNETFFKLKAYPAAASVPGDWFQFIVPCQEPYSWLCYFSIPGSFRVENFGKYFGGSFQLGVPGGYQNNLKIHSLSASRPRRIIPINWNPEHLPPLGLQSHNNGHGGLILPGTLSLSYTVLCALREPATKFSATIFRSLVLYQRSLAPPWQETCAFGLKENLHFCIKHLFWAP